MIAGLAPGRIRVSMNRNRLEYEARPQRPAKPMAPTHKLVGGATSDAAALVVLLCSSAFLGALSWWLAVWG